MADALCGPANPLQSFRKHAQTDRTLYQDRVLGPRHSPAQGFRTPDPRTGALDAEFHAFENQSVDPRQFDLQFQQKQPLAQRAPTFAPTFASFGVPNGGLAAGPAGWAADFQRLQLNDRPVPVQQFRVEAPLLTSTNGGWQDEFLRQRSSVASPVAQGKMAVRDNAARQQGYQQSHMGGQQGFQPYGLMGQQSNFAPLSQQESSQSQVEQQMANQDLERAFSDAFAEIEKADLKDEMRFTPAAEVISETKMQHENLEDVSERPIVIGADAIDYTDWQHRTPDQDARDADELARTAGQLLSSVQSDTSTKFQNSQFMDLMRKIRDREVEVQNNDLQATNSQGQTSAKGDQEPAGQRLQENLPQSGEAASFRFPDMNEVYESMIEPQLEADLRYNTDGDQYPHTQMEALHPLHPGGRYYPEQSPTSQEKRRPPVPQSVLMSGGVMNGIVDPYDL